MEKLYKTKTDSWGENNYIMAWEDWIYETNDLFKIWYSELDDEIKDEISLENWIYNEMKKELEEQV